MRDLAVTTVTGFTLTGLVLFVFAVWTRHSLLVLLLHMAQNTINYRHEFSAACSGSLGFSLAMFSSVSVIVPAVRASSHIKRPCQQDSVKHLSQTVTIFCDGIIYAAPIGSRGSTTSKSGSPVGYRELLARFQSHRTLLPIDPQRLIDLAAEAR
jgi:hypothetical protein